jgi:erythronate-4-phosphate dehydrogenase
MIRLVADDKIPFLKGVLEPYAEVNYIPGNLISSAHLKSAQGLIIRTRTRCDANLLEKSDVRFIATATIGYDHIDSEFCSRKGIEWTNAPGCNSGSVQQYIASVLMLIELNEQLPIANLTLGIVGVGNVGRKVEKLARALGMQVLLNDPPRARAEGPSSFVSLDQLLSQSDIVSIHVPLNYDGKDKTYYLANQTFFSKMKPQSWFINAARGEVCNTSDLKIAHSKGIIRDFILDVWENEPNIDHELLNQCFIGTPHIAGYSVDGKANGTSMAVNACSRYFNFKLPEWYPENLPFSGNSLIDFSSEKHNDPDLIKQAILSTYNVCADDSSLRSSTASFEILRGEYPIRREFPAYTVKIDPSRTELGKVLHDIGFKIKISE